MTDDNPYLADPPKHRDQEWLDEQYWGEERSAADIAEECGVSYQVIYRSMEWFGIQRRSRAEANQLRHRKRLFGDDEEDDDD